MVFLVVLIAEHVDVVRRRMTSSRSSPSRRI
jgi:hypothetical protein